MGSTYVLNRQGLPKICVANSSGLAVPFEESKCVLGMNRTRQSFKLSPFDIEDHERAKEGIETQRSGKIGHECDSNVVYLGCCLPCFHCWSRWIAAIGEALRIEYLVVGI